MKEDVKQNILRVLDKAIIALKANNFNDLKNISNETIHDSTVFQIGDIIKYFFITRKSFIKERFVINKIIKEL